MPSSPSTTWPPSHRALGCIVPDQSRDHRTDRARCHHPGSRRGAGVTEACGTGACAAAWAAVRFGLVDAAATEITVHMDGGDAKVRLGSTGDDPVVLIGPATFVATITVDVDDPVY
jgi:hypothetical protein